jgi:hypothetical protein
MTTIRCFWRSPEGDLVPETELCARLNAFLRTLPAKDRAMLMWGVRQHSPEYQALFKRARAAVTG